MKTLFNYSLIALITTISLSFYSCSELVKENKVMFLYPQDFKTKIENNDSCIILDIRTDLEYKKGHIANAINFDLAQEENFTAQILTLDKKKPIFVYGLNSGKSGMATADLLRNGFIEIYELDGGLTQWRKSGFAEVKFVPKKIKDLTKKQMDSILTTDKLVLAYFCAPWCAPCEWTTPSIEELAIEHPDSLKVIKIDIDSNSKICDVYHVKAIPHLIMFKNKKQVWFTIGFNGKKEITEVIEKYK